jgi:hypothetical protein
MANRDDKDRERIAVAAQRSTRPQRRSQGARPAATEAGVSLIVVIGLLAAVGWIVGGTAGAHLAGALVGGFVGLLAGFTAIYLRYRDL